MQPNLPEIPGTEGIGEVSEVSDEVTSLRVGQRVMLLGQSTWQQEIIGAASSFTPLPPQADPLQLSMMTINPITALRLLDTFVDLKKGDWVIQNAANSAVGTYLIQIAKSRGINTLNIVRRASAIQPLLDIGATSVLVDSPSLIEEIAAATNGTPIALAIDAVGGESFPKLVESLQNGSTIVCYGLLSMKQPLLPSSAIIFNDITVKGFWLSKWFREAAPADIHKTFLQIIHMVSSGLLKATIHSTYTLDEITTAVSLAAESGRDGKIVLLPNGHFHNLSL